MNNKIMSEDNKCFMCSLNFKEIESLIRLKHIEDWEYGNDEKRCKELLEDSRNVVGYTLKDYNKWVLEHGNK